MPKGWLVKRRWPVVFEATTYTRIYGQRNWGCAGVLSLVCHLKIFVVKLYSRKIFS